MLNNLKRVFLFVVAVLATLSSHAAVSVPFTMTESLYKDNSVVVNSEGESRWDSPQLDNSGATGICLGIMKVTIDFNWDDKYIDIAFQGVPDILSFSIEAAASTTGVYWYVKESSNGSNWSSEIWNSSATSGDFSVQLSETTRYVRICYSGNYDGCYSNLAISAKYLLKFVSNGETLRSEYLKAGTPISVSDPTNLSDCYHFTSWDQTVPAVMPAKDLILTALMDVDQATASFQPSDVEKGIQLARFDQTFDCGKPVVVADPSCSGFTFLKWVPELPAYGSMEMDGQLYQAEWKRNQYRYVVYTSENDSVAQMVDYQTVLDPLSAPTREGYQFLGWDVEQPTTMPAHDLTIKALWSDQQHFKLTTLINCQPTVYDYLCGDEVSLSTPHVEGYHFNGWSADVPQTMPCHDVLLVADMSPLSFKFITIDEEEQDTTLYNYSEPIQQPADPSREGFTFEGWNPQIPELMPAKDVQVTAQWKRNSYTITSVSGDDTLDVISYPYGEALVELQQPEREGYQFLGWNEELPATMPASDLTFSAVWRVNNYSLTMISEDTVTFLYTYGAKIPSVQTPERAGYTFDGWNKAFPAVMGAFNDTIEAQWSKNQYTLTWIKVENEDSLVVTYSYGESVSVLAEPERKGYEFLGWDKDVPETMPAQNLVIVADWDAIDYFLELVVNGKSERVKYRYEEEIEIPNDPSVKGYTFNKWEPELPSTMPDSSLTVVADMTMNDYTFVALMEGDTIAVRTLHYMDEVEPLDEPQKRGWMFDEWLPAIPEVMPANDVVVEASMIPLYYNFVKIVDEDTVTFTLMYGENLPIVENPEKKGYTFLQWSHEIPQTMPDANDTIVALWETNSYLLTLNLTPDSIYVDTFKYGEEVKISEDFERYGYRFVGWNETVPTTMPAYPVTLEAKWLRTLYSVTYIVEGDTLATDEYLVGETIDVRNFDREGWTWKGWMPELPDTMTAEDWTVEGVLSVNTYALRTVVGEDTTEYLYTYQSNVQQPSDPKVEGFTFVAWSDTFPAKMPASDVTIEAQLKRNVHCLVVEIDGQKDTTWYEYGEDVVEPSAPDGKGRDFIGWSAECPETMPDRDVLLTALWNTTYHYFNLVIDGDTISNAYKYGDPVAKFPNPGIVGGDFLRWSDDLPTIMPDSDVTITAIFQMRDYQLIVVDSLAEKVVNSHTVACRDTIHLEEPEHEGYTFLQWKGEVPVTMPDHDVTVAALWRINQHHFVVIWDEDTLVNTTYAFADSVVSPILPAVKEGHTFDGWDGEIPLSMPDSDVVVRALIRVNDYQISFVSQGDTLQKFDYAYGEKVRSSKVKDPKRVGYQFAGWNQPIPETMPAEDLVLEALWEAKKFTITYIAGRDTFVDEHSYGSKVQSYLPEAEEGYSFVGWSPALPDSMPASDCVTYARFEKETYEFVYVTHKNTTSVSYNFGDEVVAPETPTRKGYKFVSWSDSVPETMPSHDVKVHAIWQADCYELTLVADGEVIRRTMVAYGDSLNLPAKVLKSGHNFTGWDKKVPATMPAQDLTLTAEFKPTGELIVYTQGQTLYVTGLPENAESIVLDVLGRVVYRGLDRQIELMKNGVYTVRARHQTAKVIVR